MSERPSLESTAKLIDRVRSGDEGAMRRLVDTYAPLLAHWAHGRLPASARGLVGTEDLVQVSLVRVLRQIDRFEVRKPGAFLAYMRRSLLNQLRNEIRNAGRRPLGDEVSEAHPDPGLSALEQAIGREALENYEAALEKLTDDQKAAVVLRIELGLKHREVADALGCPTPDAARMLVTRGLERLSELMDDGGTDEEHASGEPDARGRGS